MKKFSILLALVFLCVINSGCSAHNTYGEGDSVLRIHVRAHSNDGLALLMQSKVSEAVMQYVTERLSSVDTPRKAKSVVSEEQTALKSIAERVLVENGADYGAAVRLTYEYYPTATSGKYTLTSGYYDAVSISLGQGNGDDWWSVIYPKGSETVIYKSRLVQWWESWF